MVGFTLTPIALGVSRAVCGMYVCRTGDRKLQHKASQAGESNWLWWQSLDWWMCFCASLQPSFQYDQSVDVPFHVHSICWQYRIWALCRWLQVYTERVIVVFQDVWSLRHNWFLYIEDLLCFTYMTSFNRKQFLPLFLNIIDVHAAVCMAVLMNGHIHTRSCLENIRQSKSCAGQECFGSIQVRIWRVRNKIIIHYRE